MRLFLLGLLVATLTVSASPFFISPQAGGNGQWYFGIPIPYAYITDSPVPSLNRSLQLTDVSQNGLTVVIELFIVSVLIYALTFYVAIRVTELIWQRLVVKSA